MRSQTSRNKVTDRQIHEEVAYFISKYEGQEVGNLAALVSGWVKNIKPEKAKGFVQ